MNYFKARSVLSIALNVTPLCYSYYITFTSKLQELFITFIYKLFSSSQANFKEKFQCLTYFREPS